MNSTQKKQQLASKPKRPSWLGYCRRLVAATLSLLVLALIQTAIGQTTVSANFDGAGGNDVGFTHYAPLQTPPWNEQVTWTFPSDPPGFSYRIFGGIPDIPRDPASGQDTGPARVGSFRNDATYSDFFTGVDIMNWDNTVPANLGIIAFRVNSPGFLTTFGYLAGYANRIDFRDQQGSFIFV